MRPSEHLSSFDTSLEKPLEKTDQTLENLLEMACAYGFTLPADIPRAEFLKHLLDREKTQEVGEQMLTLNESFKKIVTTITKVRQDFAAELENVMADPAQYGVDIAWRVTQKNALESFASCLRHGYQRLAFQIPTGGGKSHVLGAVVRAYVEALEKNTLENTQEVVILTSRKNLVHQLMAGETLEENNSEIMDDAEDLEEDALNLGDIRQWLIGKMDDAQIRTLVSGTNMAKEKKKDAKVTIQTYAGLGLDRIQEVHHTKMIGLLVLDEAHNLTERVRMLSHEYFDGAFAVGGSATIKGGGGRDPFKYFEPVRRSMKDELDKASLEKKLAFNESLVNLINRGELKPIRWIKGDVKIDLSEVKKTSAGSMDEEELGRLLTKNLPALKEFLRDLFTTPQPLLELSGSRSLKERTWISFVRSIAMAQELAEYCTNTLGIPSEYVDGTHSDEEFALKKQLHKEGKIKILFSCRKLTEGYDVPEVDGCLQLWPHSLSAQWMLIQELGRILRLIPSDPTRDALFVDAGYHSKVHDLASIFGVLGISSGYSGGLLAPGALRELEGKVVRGLQMGLSMEDALKVLTKDELLILFRKLPKFHTYIEGTKNAGIENNDRIEIGAIKFIEDEQLHEQLRLENQTEKELKEEYHAILKKHDITDRVSLLNIGIAAFQGKKFGRFGKGQGFSRAILGRRITRVSQEILEELADALGWKEDSEALQKEYYAVLREHKIINRLSLLHVGSIEFIGKTFGRFGKGNGFCTKVLGRCIKTVTTEVLGELADVLGWKENVKDVKKEYHAVLKEHEITNRLILLHVGSLEFMGKTFGRFGKGHGFCTTVLGRQIKRVTNEVLAELADTLGWKEDSDALQEEYYKLLKEHSITNRLSLLNVGSQKFKEKTFGSFGKGQGFCGAILGRRLPRITQEILAELADALGWKEDSEALQKEYYAVLREHKIINRLSLLHVGSIEFIGKTFGRFGKGHGFCTTVLGRNIRSVTNDILAELADTLGWEEDSEALQEEYHAVLKEHGITNRMSLLHIGSVEFIGKTFRGFGKGQGFCTAVLGRNIRSVTNDILAELADTLGWKENSEALQEEYYKVLKEHGIIDRQSLLHVGSIAFIGKTFGRFGKGHGFCKSVLGRSIPFPTKEVLEELADTLRWKEDSEALQEEYHAVLKEQGIINRVSLLSLHTLEFKRKVFGRFGKGQGFCATVLGRPIPSVTKKVLEELADSLGWKEDDYTSTQ